MRFRLLALGLLAVVPACVRAFETRGAATDAAHPDGPGPGHDVSLERSLTDRPATERASLEGGVVDRGRDLQPRDHPPAVESKCGALTECAGICVNLLSDPNNCNKCGAECTTASPCMQPICMSGKCAAAPLDEGTSCPSGLCHLGGCCTGCWDGTLCKPGTEISACGTGGVSCAACTTTCLLGTCT